MTGSNKFFTVTKTIAVLATISIVSACATPVKHGVSKLDTGRSNTFPDAIGFKIL